MDRLYRSDRVTAPSMPEHALKRLIELYFQDNVFVFNGCVYYQIDGVAMGNSLGPILANIFMAHLEETKIVNSQHYPKFYRRYVDDTFCLFESRDDALKFLDFINTLHPSIRFDMEEEKDGKLEFLDTVITRDPNSAAPNVSTKIRKTDKGLFYHFLPSFRKQYKTNLISTLVYRVYRIASNMVIFHIDVELLKQRLKLNRFPSYLVDRFIGKVLNKYHANVQCSAPTYGPDKRDVVLALPYLGPLSIILRRRILRLVHRFYPTVNLRVMFRQGFRISNMFNYKDRFPVSCRSIVVYRVCCKKCGPSQAYIGKTVNTLYERFNASGSGHLHPNNVESALLNHINSSGDPDCAFHFDDVTILDSGRYDQEIRFIESILLKYDHQNLNTCERSIPLEIV